MLYPVTFEEFKYLLSKTNILAKRPLSTLDNFIRYFKLDIMIFKLRYFKLDIMIFTCCGTKNNNFTEEYVLFKIKNTKPLPNELALGSMQNDTTIDIYEMSLWCNLKLS